jgi:hypothetical protein
MAGQALSSLIRFVSVLLGHEPFLASMTALAEFADLLFEQLFMLCGMGIVTAGTFKFFKRIMSPLLSQLFFDVRMTIEACFEANRSLLSPSRLFGQQEHKDHHKKCQITG